jgi:hypothetical protein
MVGSARRLGRHAPRSAGRGRPPRAPSRAPPARARRCRARRARRAPLPCVASPPGHRLQGVPGGPRGKFAHARCGHPRGVTRGRGRWGPAPPILAPRRDRVYTRRRIASHPTCSRGTPPPHPRRARRRSRAHPAPAPPAPACPPRRPHCAAMRAAMRAARAMHLALLALAACCGGRRQGGGVAGCAGAAHVTPPARLARGRPARPGLRPTAQLPYSPHPSPPPQASPLAAFREPMPPAARAAPARPPPWPRCAPPMRPPTPAPSSSPSTAPCLPPMPPLPVAPSR